MERVIEKVLFPVPQQPKLLRVAAYARVSSGKDAMLHSLFSQVSYYNSLIRSHSGWIYAGVYSDEAITGTKDDREGFQKLLCDCRNGKIDLVIAKSITRFARNTVILLETVRELKDIGVDVYFEEQNIHTISSEGELMLTILASYAQEESRSVSENQKWRVRKGFENGELVCLRHLFGYEISKGSVRINEAEAAVVREIFRRAVAGESFSGIARSLNERGIKTMFGFCWTTRTISQLLENEKYTGNALLQKSFVNNHLEKKRIVNTGQLPKYYSENTHEAMIDAETWDKAQKILAKTKDDAKKRGSPERTPLTALVRCAKCGKPYKRVTKRHKKVWVCTTWREKGAGFCQQPGIPEEILYKEIAAALDVPDLQHEQIREYVTEIKADGHDLILRLRDGSTVKRTWTPPARSASWTEEMRKKASEKAKEQRRNGK